MPSLFTKIMNREIPGKFEFEDDVCVAIRDIQPEAPIHLLIVPRKEIRSLADLEAGDEKILGHLLTVASRLAEKLGVDQSGYRIVINTNADAGQSVDHLHVHLLAGRSLKWPPG